MVVPIKAIIFDLGNVLINYSFERAFEKWAELTGYPQTHFKSRFSYDNATLYAFEQGKISPSEYFEYLTTLFGIQWTFEQFQEGWLFTNIGVNTIMLPILDFLKTDYKIYALSNINELHAQNIIERFPQLFSYFEKCFFSHDLSSRKPQKEIYQKVINLIKLKPEELLFIDDMEINIEGAKKVGIKVIQMHSKSQLILDMNKLGMDLNNLIEE